MIIKERQEYEMSDEELQAIKDISNDRTPVIFVGTWLGLDKQERANNFWVQLGRKYGFDGMSVEPIKGKGSKFYTAIPKNNGE